ncbi:MAG: alkaline phosphatase family protein [Verrucomicrobia bacterium]|nr:alkaline phosphatase family protein [Verrucomicrobiota bacterium]
MKNPLRLAWRFLVFALPVLSGAGEVRWIWSGAQTPDSLRIKVKFGTSKAAPLTYAPAGAAGVVPAQVAPTNAVAAGDGWIADYHLRGLKSATSYHYSVGGAAGRVSTLPPRGPASFTLALSSCSGTGSAHEVFRAIAAHAPLFFLHMGDLHYEDIAVNDAAVFHAAIDRALTSPTQGILFRSTAVNYMWDDHDFGPNNSNRASPSREASRRVYREVVPHHPLVIGENGPVYHAFSVGRVRFILTDLRSERSPLTVPNGPARSMLGPAQKAWLKAELLAARNTHALTVWVNSVPWIGADTGSEYEDRWTGFVTERAELSAFLEEHGVRNLCVLSGDAHMLAIDDGANNLYGPSGRPLFPVFQAAALDRKGSVKGGPYSHGTFPGPGQFGLMRVVDEGGQDVRVEWSGHNHKGEELVRHSFTVTVPSTDRT